MSDELKPCPFCGGEAELLPYCGDGNRCMGMTYAHVRCKKCHAMTETKQRVFDYDHEKSDAIEAWNSRTPE